MRNSYNELYMKNQLLYQHNINENYALLKTLIIENRNLTRNKSSNNENKFEINLPENKAKGKNYILNEDCCIRL
jgi:hypothetical protein